jgi:DNA-binding IclR family transcriptional regulator
VVYALISLCVLEGNSDGKFRFGARLYSVAKDQAEAMDLVPTIRTHLPEINQKTGLSDFLGIRAGMRAVTMSWV